MIKKLLLFLFLPIILAGCGASSDPISFFIPDKLPDAVVGKSYDGTYSFCDPAPNGVNALCDGKDPTGNPFGGNAPYHFTLEPGVGFPPIGMKLELNGLFTGTPSNSGISEFTVCAVDLSASQECKKTSIIVHDSAKLTVNKEGSGTGVVSNKEINCGDKCSESYEIGDSVSLSAKADEGSTFDKWSGECTGQYYCSFKMTKDTEVTASFSKFDLVIESATCKYIGPSSGGQYNEYEVKLSGTATGPESSSIKFYNNLNVIFPIEQDCGDWERCRAKGGSDSTSWSKSYTFISSQKPFNYEPGVAILDRDSIHKTVKLVCQ